MTNKTVRILAIILLAALVAAQITWMYHKSKSGEQVGGYVGLPAEGKAENPTIMRGPSHVAKAMLDARTLYTQVKVYRSLHGGNYPPSSVAFFVDRLNNYKRYGCRSFSEATTPFGVNPDMAYSDVPAFRQKWTVIDPFVTPLMRPDGSAKNGRKSPGTRDVVAYTGMYFHLNLRHYNGFKDTINPQGFYVVVWDDGAVEKVPYANVLWVRHPGQQSYALAFKGEAGVPSDAISFEQLYSKTPRT